jgi:S-adenosylmethionine:tRNA ribosyltransferase-isomerase
LNDTRVIPARLHARKPSGGRIEVFLVEPASCDGCRSDVGAGGGWTEHWRVLVRGLGRWAPGTRLAFDAPVEGEVHARSARGGAVIRFSGAGQGGLLAAIEGHAEIPLPPYIEAARRRLPTLPSVDDRVSYQTVYARAPGAVAAPTAGLHFTQALLARLEEAGHEIARITLHVGPGTFRPVNTDNPSEHRLDGERFEVDADAAARIGRAKAEGRPVVAVGTTVVRTLETLARRGPIEPACGVTELLILPGDEFRVVTDLVTNFHLPKSSLLMLVSAFVGSRENVLSAYREAVVRGYRFYSYGDAMFIRPGSIPA